MVEGKKGLGGGIEKALFPLAAVLVCHLKLCVNCSFCHITFFTTAHAQAVLKALEHSLLNRVNYIHT